MKQPMTLPQKMVIALVLGGAVGLFGGELVAPLQIVADGYVKLLQMTVLPYLMVSLVSGLGGLSLAHARAMAWRVGGLLALLWAVALAAVFVFPLMFPPMQSASFFSTTLVDDPQPFDLVNLYIPSNPFNSMANNVVPAVVVFSIVIGVALIGVERKERLLEVLATLTAAMSRINSFVAGLTPYGLFAIMAVAAGTLRPEELARMRVYNVSYIAMSLLISLWVLPGLVATLTPVRYRDVLARTREPLITAFLTSNLFIVLPMLTDAVKGLLAEHRTEGDADQTLPGIIVPASFNFPHVGKLLSLSYVLFAGWFADTAVPVQDYLQLAVVGFFTLFGSLNIAIPYLLDLFRIPADTFQLFLAASVVNARFGTLIAAVHTVAIALLGTCAVTGLLRVSPRRLLRYAAVTLALVAATVVGVRAVLALTTEQTYTRDRAVLDMRIGAGYQPGTVFADETVAAPLPPVETSLLQRVRSRKAVRVGYFADNPPYAFTNARGEVVGLDIEMAYQLASDLGVQLELVPLSRAVLEGPLDATRCDILMAGIAVTPERAANMLFSASYLDETLALLVPDHRREAFASWGSIRSMGAVRIGVPPAAYLENRLRAQVPEAQLVRYNGLDDIFGTAQRVDAEAYLATAERGSIWTLLHPEYSVVVPRPGRFAAPLAYAVAGRDLRLAEFVTAWVELKRKDGTIGGLFDRWILGRASEASAPRWSVIRDVLHWVE